MIDRDTQSEKHPSYGQLKFFRVSGGHSCLYGSPVRKIGESIFLEIHQSEHHVSFGESMFYPKEPIIRLELSAAQFASLITTIHTGTGTPCTIRQLHGKKVPAKEFPPPDNEVIADKIANDSTFSKAIIGSLRKAQKITSAILSRSGAPRKGDVRRVETELRAIDREISDNLPFLLTLYREAMERIDTAVRAEADFWVTSMVQRAGLEALRVEQVARKEIIDQSEDQ